jgi:hypothetical protein
MVKTDDCISSHSYFLLLRERTFGIDILDLVWKVSLAVASWFFFLNTIG